MCLSVSFPAADVSDGSTASLPGMIFAINHLANIIHLSDVMSSLVIIVSTLY